MAAGHPRRDRQRSGAVITVLGRSAPQLAQMLACSTAELHDVDMSYAEAVIELDQYVKSLTEATSERLALLAYLGFMEIWSGTSPSPSRLLMKSRPSPDSASSSLSGAEDAFAR